MSEDNQPISSSSKSNSGRPESLVWNHFYKKMESKSRGHFSATCHYCGKEWSRGKPDILEDHLATECLYCSNNIRNDYLEIVSKRIVTNNKETTTSTIKKRK